MSTSWEVYSETMAGVNSCFAEVTENDILRTHIITIPNDTKKATKLGMIVSKINNVLTHNLLTCPVSSILIAKLRWCLRLLKQQLSFHLPFQSSIQVSFHSAKCLHLSRYLSLKWLWFPTLQQQAHGMISGGKFTNCSFIFYFK